MSGYVTVPQCRFLLFEGVVVLYEFATILVPAGYTQGIKK
jgi:hypothetical protein